MFRLLHPTRLAWSLAVVVSVSVVPTVVGQGKAAPVVGELKDQMETIKGTLASSKLSTVDPITAYASSFRTELDSYSAEEMTFKNIRRIELGGQELDGSYTNLFTFKLRDMVLNVPWRGFMNGMTVTLSCAADAQCVRDEEGQMLPSVTIYVSRDMAAPLQKALKQVLQAAGAQAPAPKTP
jgi:hypothetical protein